MFVRSSTYFKVHFTEALDLVRGRRVHVEGGFCFVPETEMLSLVAHIFRQHLAQALVYTNKILPGLNEHERIVQVVGELNSRYTGADYTRKEGEPSIKPEMIKPMAEKNDFPLCMRSMQATLDSTHHLKYRARLQYGLFLKGIGLSLEDAIRFFRGEFTRGHVDADKFDKEYAYGIRHSVLRQGGQEGQLGALELHAHHQRERGAGREPRLPLPPQRPRGPPRPPLQDGYGRRQDGRDPAGGQGRPLPEGVLHAVRGDPLRAGAEHGARQPPEPVLQRERQGAGGRQQRQRRQSQDREGAAIRGSAEE